MTRLKKHQSGRKSDKPQEKQKKKLKKLESVRDSQKHLEKKYKNN